MGGSWVRPKKCPTERQLRSVARTSLWKAISQGLSSCPPAFSLVTDVTTAFDKPSGTPVVLITAQAAHVPEVHQTLRTERYALHRCALHAGKSGSHGPGDGPLGTRQLGYEELSMQTVRPEELFPVRRWPLSEQLVVQDVPSLQCTRALWCSASLACGCSAERSWHTRECRPQPERQRESAGPAMETYQSSNQLLSRVGISLRRIELGSAS